MSSFKYVPIINLFAKLQRDFPLEFKEGDAIEWTAEALEAIGAVRQYEEAVCFLEVSNHQAELPAGLHAIIQIARNHCYTETEQQGLCPAEAVEAQQESSSTTSQPPASVPIAIDCNGQPLEEYELAYFRPYFDLQWEYGAWTTSRLAGCFQPVNLAESSFFDSIVCTLPDRSLYDNCRDEYTIIMGKTLRFNFEKGQVAVAYLRQVLDPETGYPMIPDHYSFTTAVTAYIIYKMTEREFWAGRQGSDSRMMKAESNWHWYCKQAGNYAMQLKGIDEHENFFRQNQYMLPRQNRYYGFIGKIAFPEDRRFNDPSGRNINYFRGV